jgi:hypothetical protein
MTTQLNVFTHMEDRPLLDAAKQLVTDERRATAALLRALTEIDSWRLYLGEGCASMFSYCTQVLHLAEGAAYNRIEAARAARRYPLILELFEQSAITLTTVRLLAPHLTAENHVAVLMAATHKSKRDIEELAVSLKPKPDAPVVVRKLPTPPTAPMVPVVSTSKRLPAPVETASPPTGESQRDLSLKPPAARIEPLAPERYRIQLTVSRETHDKFRRAQALLTHAVPSGDPAEIFDRAVTLLVERLEHQRFAQTARPRGTTTSASHSRHLPAAVRRAVWRRDAGRCAFAGAEGRCLERAFLEFHHLEPYAAGGATSVENLELRCRAHNVYEAQLFFGADVVREESVDSAWTRSGTSSELTAG